MKAGTCSCVKQPHTDSDSFFKECILSTGRSKTSLRALSEIQALNTPSTCHVSKLCKISINMPQSNELSNVIQNPATEVEDMDYEFNHSNKRKITLLETKNQDDITNLEEKVSAVEVEIVTLKNQIKPLLSLPSTVDEMKVSTKKGFTATLDKLNALTDLLKAGNLGAPPPSKPQQQRSTSTRTPYTPK
ncbi:hypothetical protein DAPPUDRAFT_326617 [Daphnia pulex]|uniref:Uncharacterized protein n=1 Tax=Daphnia pulex TaxID=6669 RepID=E9H8A2_DAPPU|nr:hypothetical protein DAPPUDRAFT_326617 [Daphnia pulex]|eukprot:EFX72062.1 hypothetical protein DAPPUDRAFT_326617 [Daphnia pulex]